MIHRAENISKQQNLTSVKSPQTLPLQSNRLCQKKKKTE